MLWLAGQIAVFLLIAAVLGLVIGWLLRSLWPSSRARAREGELQTALDRATARISDLEAGLRAKRAAAAALAEQEQAALRRVEQVEAALDQANRDAAATSEEQDRLRGEAETSRTQAAALRERIAELEVEVATLPAVEAARDAAQARAAALEAELARSASPQRPLFAVPDGGDDPASADAEQAENLTEEPEPPVFREPESTIDVEGVEAGGEPTADGPGPGALRGNAATIEPIADAGEPRPIEPAEEPPPELLEESPEQEAIRLEEERLQAVAEAAARFEPDQPVEPDDLREIYGVGPALERLLHSMNIFTFAQIANFSEDDVELVSTALGKSFPDRITRDDWIGSARGLHRLKYGEEPPPP